MHLCCRFCTAALLHERYTSSKQAYQPFNAYNYRLQYSLGSQLLISICTSSSSSSLPRAAAGPSTTVLQHSASNKGAPGKTYSAMSFRCKMQHQSNQSLVLCALVVAAMLIITPASAQDAARLPISASPPVPPNSSALPESSAPAALAAVSGAAGNATTLKALKTEMDGAAAPGTPSGLTVATTTTTTVPANTSVLQPGSQASTRAFKLAPNITTVTKSQLGR
jgi:hypothetical protein